LHLFGHVLDACCLHAGQTYRPLRGWSMVFVEQILKQKGGAFWSVAPDAMVIDALKLMAEKDVGALLVLGAERLAGIISERDYARKVVLKGKSSLQTPVREIMTQVVVTVHPGNTVEECMGLMTEKRIRHLPVVVEGQVVGIISIGDIVKATLAAKDFVIEQLGNYITGDR
jgi:signal-transduction protein with cAMP-binding, CBS, and nucleotidyltransferase domain